MRTDVPFPELSSLGAGEKTVALCKHLECRKLIEKIGNTWFHADGSRQCARTHAEPEE